MDFGNVNISSLSLRVPFVSHKSTHFNIIYVVKGGHDEHSNTS